MVTVWCFLPLNLGEALFFRCRSTRWSPYGFFDYAPPDTGVPNLQLVSVEYLPSIEGALEIQMNVTFLRGKAPLPGADSPYQGEMSRRDKRGRDAVSRRLTERLSQIYIKNKTASLACGLKRKKRAQRKRDSANSGGSFRRGRF